MASVAWPPRTRCNELLCTPKVWFAIFRVIKQILRMRPSNRPQRQTPTYTGELSEKPIWGIEGRPRRLKILSKLKSSLFQTLESSAIVLARTTRVLTLRKRGQTIHVANVRRQLASSAQQTARDKNSASGSWFRFFTLFYSTFQQAKDLPRWCWAPYLGHCKRFNCSGTSCRITFVSSVLTLTHGKDQALYSISWCTSLLWRNYHPWSVQVP